MIVDLKCLCSVLFYFSSMLYVNERKRTYTWVITANTDNLYRNIYSIIITELFHYFYLLHIYIYKMKRMCEIIIHDIRNILVNAVSYVRHAGGVAGRTTPPTLTSRATASRASVYVTYGMLSLPLSMCSRICIRVVRVWYLLSASRIGFNRGRTAVARTTTEHNRPS